MMTNLSPRVNETADEFVRREAAAWKALEPAEVEPDYPDDSDALWAAETSPLNAPGASVWNERWTTTEEPSLQSLYAMDACEAAALYSRLPNLDAYNDHELAALYFAVWSELQERMNP